MQLTLLSQTPHPRCPRSDRSRLSLILFLDRKPEIHSLAAQRPLPASRSSSRALAVSWLCSLVCVLRTRPPPSRQQEACQVWLRIADYLTFICQILPRTPVVLEGTIRTNHVPTITVLHDTIVNCPRKGERLVSAGSLARTLHDLCFAEWHFPLPISGGVLVSRSTRNLAWLRRLLYGDVASLRD